MSMSPINLPTVTPKLNILEQTGLTKKGKVFSATQLHILTC